MRATHQIGTFIDMICKNVVLSKCVFEPMAIIQAASTAQCPCHLPIVCKTGKNMAVDGTEQFVEQTIFDIAESTPKHQSWCYCVIGWPCFVVVSHTTFSRAGSSKWALLARNRFFRETSLRQLVQTTATKEVITAS